MIRLFIALKIEEEIQEKFGAIISDFRTKGGKIRWVDSKNLHLTLKFLGNTEPKEVELIIAALQNELAQSHAIESDFNALGGFPNLRKPKVIWADINKNKESVIEVAQKIDSACEGLGFEINDKPFQPHLTLGRVKSYEGLAELTEYLAQYKFENFRLTFNRVQLIKSTLTQSGPIYKVLKEFELSERFGG